MMVRFCRKLPQTRRKQCLVSTAVAVHPDDETLNILIGKKIHFLPLMTLKIPIIADEKLKWIFGIGVVKITPAHDPK